MVSALDSGSKGLGSNPGWGHFFCVLGQDIELSQCLSPLSSMNVYRQIYLGWGGVGATCDGPSIPSRRSNNTPTCL